MKPNFDDAPLWAKYHAVDANGDGFWFSVKPEIDLSSEIWFIEDGSVTHDGGDPLHMWKESLNERP